MIKYDITHCKQGRYRRADRSISRQMIILTLLSNSRADQRTYVSFLFIQSKDSQVIVISCRYSQLHKGSVDRLCNIMRVIMTHPSSIISSIEKPCSRRCTGIPLYLEHNDGTDPARCIVLTSQASRNRDHRSIQLVYYDLPSQNQIALHMGPSSTMNLCSET